jgi:hypothetical protein
LATEGMIRFWNAMQFIQRMADIGLSLRFANMRGGSGCGKLFQ